VLPPPMLPPSISVPPKDQFVSRGGILQLQVVAKSNTRVSYQWFFNDQMLGGETGPTLTIHDVQANREGDYYVVVSNLDGSVQSPKAHVTLREPGLLPVFILQPELSNAVLPIRAGRTYDPIRGGEIPSVKILPGYSIALHTIARSELPVTYTWFRGTEPLATEATGVLNLTSLQPNDSGDYSVRAQNAAGAAEARLPYRLVVPKLAADWKPGAIAFGNSNASLVLDTDGATLLGSGFSVQCYAGEFADYLIAVGSPLSFQSESSAGIFGPVIVQVPDVLPGKMVFVQAKAWESAKGKSYEQAKDAGGKVGASAIVQVMTAKSEEVPLSSGLPGLKSFQLRSALPDQPSIKFTGGRVLEDGRPQWTLAGETGIYLVERKSASFTWVPIALVTNVAFTATFSDVLKPGEATLYRARRYE
jgi:hypothetical protein